MSRQHAKQKTKPGRRRLLPQAGLAALLNLLRTTPIGVLGVAWLAYWQLDNLPVQVLSALPILSYMVMSFAIAVMLCFGQGTAFFLLLSTAFANVLLPTPDGVLYALLSVLLPINTLVFSLLPNRSISSAVGRFGLAVLLVEALLGALLLLSEDAWLAGLLRYSFIDLAVTPLPQLALLLYGGAAFILFGHRRRNKRNGNIAAFCMLTACMLANHWARAVAAKELFYAAAGLIMLVYVIQDYYFKAYMDELTGLQSRRSLNERMASLQSGYVVAMLDIDFFKKINDTYGHDVGDDVLRFVGGLIGQHAGKQAFRYGGEEFTILYRGLSLEEVLAELEVLRQTIERRPFVLRGAGSKPGKRLKVTVSIGAAATVPRQKNPQDVIKRADAALYQAKENGRNCICA